VSVILPAYLSEATLEGCLVALRRQSFQDFETFVVDSGPTEACAEIAARFPEVHLERSPQRLYPHAARNRGAELARGDLLVFIDPDVYAHPEWLARLVAIHEATGHTVVGALACHGPRWRDHGIHLCKFSKWLPGGKPRPLDMSPTANMLISRAAFEAVGGFEGDLFLGDALLSWQLQDGGATLWFEPAAVVEHHHLDTVGAFLRERYRRGILFGELRARWQHHGRARNLLYLAVSMPPIRLLRILPLTLRHALTARQLGLYLVTLPLVAAGHAASLAGEAVAYGQLVRTRQVEMG
jgi:glycosyltransferase involved in cell wall biosynthesis